MLLHDLPKSFLLDFNLFKGYLKEVLEDVLIGLTGCVVWNQVYEGPPSEFACVKIKHTHDMLYVWLWNFKFRVFFVFFYWFEEQLKTVVRTRVDADVVRIYRKQQLFDVEEDYLEVNLEVGLLRIRLGFNLLGLEQIGRGWFLTRIILKSLGEE